MFANNHHDDGHVAVWLPAGPGVQDAVIEEAPQIFFRPPYVGPAGWIGVEMARIDDDWLGSLIREAFHLAAKDHVAASRVKPFQCLVPASSRAYFLDAFFFRCRILPSSMITSCSYVMPSMVIRPNETLSIRIAPPLGS
jgi:hypothetical protein